jgi:hypothetical protein
MDRRNQDAHYERSDMTPLLSVARPIQREIPMATDSEEMVWTPPTLKGE